MARLAPRTHSRHSAQSGSRAVHSDRSPVCAAAARPGHRCSDRKFLREFGGWLATNAPARAAAEVPREMRATTHTHLCSSRPASQNESLLRAPTHHPDRAADPEVSGWEGSPPNDDTTLFCLTQT